MNCARCDEQTTVLETRAADGGSALRRRRACTACGHRFTTFERCGPEPLFVHKRDGGRQRFEPGKLCAALRRATHKRPIDRDEIDSIVSRAAGEIDAAGGELGADLLAAFCLRELQRLDPDGAYLQYLGTLSGPNAQFATAEEPAGAPGSVRAASEHGQSTPKAGTRRGLHD